MLSWPMLHAIYVSFGFHQALSLETAASETTQTKEIVQGYLNSDDYWLLMANARHFPNKPMQRYYTKLRYTRGAAYCCKPYDVSHVAFPRNGAVSFGTITNSRPPNKRAQRSVMSLVLDFALPAPPATWDNTQATVAHAGISASRLLQIEPVNQHFLAHARRKRHGRTLSEDDRVQAELKAEEQDEDNEAVEVEDEPETKALLELDPKDWKDQDHYAVLGLSKLRYKATPAQIKKARKFHLTNHLTARNLLAYYSHPIHSDRKKLLKHHPDKKAASGDINDDSFFKCIQKAYETLSDPTRRRQYDSVDPRVEDLVPKPARPDQFYEVYKPCFEREARFSRRLPVPELGGPETERETVTEFYDFWWVS
ncbi:hypothetical protein BC938DRAFT_471873, partial [Jimgerdemannia flammicorona]